MFAIVSIAGQQFKVEEGQQIFVHRLDAKKGDKITFDQIHLTADGGNVNVGTPTLKGMGIQATVIEEMLKGDKVIIFKKKRRKGYRLKKGHRQQYTKLEINSISGVAAKSEKAQSTKVKESAPATQPKAPETVQMDDLTIVEGIGPKVQELFNAHDIHTYAQLADTDIADLKKILDNQGGTYQAMDPGTWPKQAGMAAEGKMDELKAWQDEMQGGRSEA